MLRERTDPAFARAFKRIAQLALVGIALAGLTACGGGGSSTPKAATPAETPTPTPPEIPITPTPTDLPPPTEAELAAATVLSAGETTSGTLESTDAVKYYSLDIDERRTIEFTLDAEEGIEMTILDEHGNIITSGVTSSPLTRILTLAEGKYFIRIRDAIKKAQDRTFRFLAKYGVDPVSLIKSSINLVRLIPHVRVTIQGTTYEFDARDHLQTPDGRKINFRLAASRGGVRVALEGTTARFQATGEAVPGDLDFTLTACVPDTGECRTELVRVTVDQHTRGLRVKPEFSTSGGSFTMQGGLDGGSPALTFPSTSQVTYLRNYFEYEDEPGQAESPAWWRERRAWSYAAATQPSPAAGWRAEIAGTSPNQLLRVTGPVSSNTQSAKTINVAVTVTKRVTATVEETATVRFTFSLEEVEEPTTPGGTPAPVSAACERMLGLYAEWVAAEAERLRLSTCTDNVINDAAAYHEQQLNGIRSGNSPLPSEVRRELRWCPVDKGYVTPPALVAAGQAASAAAEAYSAAYRELERANPGRAGGICGYGSG